MTHVLTVYVVLTAASWTVASLDRSYVVIGMIGGLVPDLAKIELVVPDYAAESVLGIPFTWSGLHTSGGALLTAGIAALLFPKKHRKPALGLMALGAAVHLSLDAFLAKPDPSLYPLLFPLSTWEPPVAGIYLSSDKWLSWVAMPTALAVFLIDRYRQK